MSRDPRNQQLRLRVAQLAARLMMEHGIKDHAQAKRKAARQLGVTTANLLPGNDEIDAELRMYANLFEPDAFEREVGVRRRQALDVMAILRSFRPMLVGGLVQGVAAPHADIELEVYADSSKEFEQFLVNAEIEFKSEERREGSFFTLFSHPADVQVRVLPVQSIQSASRAASDARRRLSEDQLRRMLSDAGEGIAEDEVSRGHESPDFHRFGSLAGSGE